MSLHQEIKKAVTQNKQKIELTQWAIMSAFATLIYAEYISSFKQVHMPVHRVMVPKVATVREYLEPDGPYMMGWMSNWLIEIMSKHTLFRAHADAPELAMFQEENIEIMKTVFDLYITPNLQARIPEAITKKFELDNDKAQLFWESNDTHFFNHQPVDDALLHFVADQAVLQMMALLPTVKQDVRYPDDNRAIFMTGSDIVCIGNGNALCPVYIDAGIMRNDEAMKMIKFVTSTIVIDLQDNALTREEEGEPAKWRLETNPFNQVKLIRFGRSGEVNRPNPEESSGSEESV